MPAGLDENLSLEVRWRLSDGRDVADEKRRSALDGLKRLEKVYKSQGLGFYGRHFRGTGRPQQSSWFTKYRKLEKANIHNPGFFVPSYCGLFFGKPTPKEAFYNIQVVNRCEDHRVKIKDHEKNKEWARKAKEDIEFQKEALQEDVRLADKGSKYQDELIRDLTEGFLAGEFIDRNLESVGSSSKALTVLVWRELA